MKQYNTYIESGAEWIGKIPSHWNIKKFKYIFKLVSDKNEKELPKVGLENIESWTGKYINTGTEFEGDGEVFLPKDILFGKLRPYLAKVYLAEFTGKAVGDIFVFRSGNEINAEYGSHLLLSKNFIELTTSSTFGAKMPRVSWEFISNQLSPIPPIQEQIAIATYLNQKIAELDGLIADKKYLLELYEEEMKALINKAVTKGITSDIKLKDSGVEWLGDIPEHWEMKRLKYVASINDESIPETTEENYEIEYIEISNVKSGIGIIETSTFLFKEAPSRARRIVKDGDIIVSTVRTYLKSIATINKPIHNLIASTGFAVIRPRKLESDYLGYLFYSEFLIGEIISLSTGVSYPAINANQIGNIFIPIPSEKEQQFIVKHIETECIRIDAKKARTQKLIELLTEYRTALISEVVTGKIKVID